MKALAVGLVCMLLCGNALARTQTPATKQFRKTVACPATNVVSKTCPGYVADHIWPLCAGGPDEQWNLRWQKVEDSYRKDVLERRACRAQKGK